jgi:ribosomal protein S21
MINVEITRDQSESNSSLIRRFSKRLSGSNVIRKVKSLKAAERPQSHFKKKKSALKRLAKKTEFARLYKLGKISNAFGKTYRSR